MGEQALQRSNPNFMQNLNRRLSLDDCHTKTAAVPESQIVNVQNPIHSMADWTGPSEQFFQGRLRFPHF